MNMQASTTPGASVGAQPNPSINPSESPQGTGGARGNPEDPARSPATGQPERQAQGQQGTPDRVAELLRRERKLHSRESQIKSQSGDLELGQRIKSAESIPEKLKAAGMTYSEITEYFMNRSDNDVVEQLKSRIDELEGTTRKTQQQLTEKELEQIRSSGHAEIKRLLDDSEFELAKSLGANETIYSIIEDHYRNTGEEMGFSDAAKIVEDEIVQQLNMLKGNSRVADLLGLKGEDPGIEKPKPQSTPGFFSAPRIDHAPAGGLATQRSNTSLGAIETGHGVPNDKPRSDADTYQDAIALLKKFHSR